MARCRASPCRENVVLTRHATDAALVQVRHGEQRRGGRRSATASSRTSTCARASPTPKRARCRAATCRNSSIGRELDRKPGVLVVNQPTWGVDAGAAATIRQALIDLARQGSAVLVISQDLDEIFEIADRIAVISRGELSEAYPAAEPQRGEDRPADGGRA